MNLIRGDGCMPPKKHLEVTVDAHGLGNGCDVEKAFSSGRAVESLGLLGEATCGMILSLPQGLSSLAAQMEGAADRGHDGSEIRVTLRTGCRPFEGRLTGRAGVCLFTHVTGLNRMLLGN